MAVIQISKIQVRRGKASENGIPQLSSAEFAWAVDDQVLYIGNGSVAEGAPFVGNTRILTEYDNILELASSYQFGINNPSINLSVPRSLQSKIDETAVSVVDFGALGNGVIDSIAFANAVSELFVDTPVELKKVLIIPNGVYTFSDNLQLPSGVTLKGETRDGAVLSMGQYNIEFDNTASDVNISNLTIQFTTGQAILSGLTSSEFKQVTFLGTYTLEQLDTNIQACIIWEDTNSANKVTDIVFTQCKFKNTPIAIEVDQSSIIQSITTNVIFQNCEFKENYKSIVINSNSTTSQKNNWKIVDCIFEKVARHAFESTNSQGTFIHRSSFLNCGNDNNEASIPVSSIISFSELSKNTVTTCMFNRHNNAYITSTPPTSSVFAEVENASRTEISDINHVDIFRKENPFQLSIFSNKNKFTNIDYVLHLGTSSRHGTLNITIDQNSTHASITDNYSYSSDETVDNVAIITNFQFLVSLNNTVNSLQLLHRNFVVGLDEPAPFTGSLSYSVGYSV